MTVILRNPFRAGARGGRISVDRERQAEQTEGRAFDDVIICSNARALPGLIIRCYLPLSSPRSAFSSFLLLSSLSPTIIARALTLRALTPFDG